MQLNIKQTKECKNEMKPWAEQFYKSKLWQKCRAAYIASVFGLCERCRRRGIVKPGKIVHHKIKLTPENINDHSISLNFRNLEYLCQECHNEEHHQKHGNTRKGLAFDAYGNLVQVSEAANNGEM